MTVSSLARGDRYRRERRGWTACDGNCRPRWERRSTPSVKRWWSQCLDRSNKRAASGNFSAWFAEGARRVGPGLSDAQHFEVTSALLWIELETTKKGHYIKVRAALGKPFSKHGSELHGVNSDGLCSTIRFSAAQAAFKKQFSDGLLGELEGIR